MKKLLLIGLMLFATSASAFEFRDWRGNWVSDHCNSIYRPWWVIIAPLPVGWSCMMPDGTPGVVGG